MDGLQTGTSSEFNVQFSGKLVLPESTSTIQLPDLKTKSPTIRRPKRHSAKMQRCNWRFSWGKDKLLNGFFHKKPTAKKAANILLNDFMSPLFASGAFTEKTFSPQCGRVRPLEPLRFSLGDWKAIFRTQYFIAKLGQTKKPIYFLPKYMVLGYDTLFLFWRYWPYFGNCMGLSGVLEGSPIRIWIQEMAMARAPKPPLGALEFWRYFSVEWALMSIFEKKIHNVKAFQRLLSNQVYSAPPRVGKNGSGFLNGPLVFVFKRRLFFSQFFFLGPKLGRGFFFFPPPKGNPLL